MIDILISLAMVVAVAAVFFFLLGWRYHVEPGIAAERYSRIIVTIFGLYILLAIFVDESVNGASAIMSYEDIVHYIMIFIVHLLAAATKRPSLVLAAISLMIGNYVAMAVMVALKWLPIPTIGEFIGLGVALLFLAYAMHGTLRSKSQISPT
jgi:hypothetical protein